jgi:hypothetical protein
LPELELRVWVILADWLDSFVYENRGEMAGEITILVSYSIIEEAHL